MNNKLSLSFEITADPAKLKAGLAVSRRDILATYADIKTSVGEASKKLTEAQAEAQALGRALSANGAPTRAMVAEFEKARAAVVAAKEAVVAKTAALQQQRGLAQANADAIFAATRSGQQTAIAAAAATSAAQRAAHQVRMNDLAQEIAAAKAAALADQARAVAARDDALKASSRATAAAVAAKNMAVGTSLGTLSLRGSNTIRQEIADVNRALATLRINGAAAQDIARAAQAAKEKVAALNAELNTTGNAAAGASGNLAGTTSHMAAMAVAALSVHEAIQLLKGSVSTGIQFDSLKTQSVFANGGDIRKGAEEMDFASKLSNQLGLELIGTSKAYAKLQASAKGTVLEGAATRDIFQAVASAGAVMGLTADEQAGALLAISQMMSKGTVSAEELKGQLGERLPGAFQIASKAMGVTTADLQKMLEAGQVMSADFLPKFAAALQASVSGSLPAAEASTRAQLQRLENAFTEFKLRIANSGLLDKVAEQLERVLDHIGNMADSGELDKLASQFAATFGAVVEFLADASIVATRFADTLGTLATAVAAVVLGGRALAIFGGASAGIAEAGASASAAAAGFGLLTGAIRVLKNLTVGGLVLTGVEKLIEWGAAASEARRHAEALEAQIQKLINTNSEHASTAMRDAAGIKEFGDLAFDAYEKAIKGARDYAAAKVVNLTQNNDKGLPKGLGKFDDAIEFYSQQATAYNEYLDTVVAGERLRREQFKLTGQIIKLEADREKILAGEVTQTRSEALSAQIKGYEKLVEAIGKAREESQKEAEGAKNKATGLRDQAQQVLQSAQDKAQSMREQGLPEEVRRQNDAERAQSAIRDGSFYASAAAAAQLDGRSKDFEKYAKEAEKFLDRAMQFSEKSGDANLVEETGAAQAGLKKTQAKAEDSKAMEAEQQAASLMDQLNQAQGKLTEMKGEMSTLKINAEITDAINNLNAVEAKIAALSDKTVTITVNTAGNIPSDIKGMSGAENSIPARAYGGPLPGTAPHDRADNMLYWGTPGEWVIQRPTVRMWGEANMRLINAGQMPRFAFGGQLGSAASRIAIPRLTPKVYGANQKAQTPLVLDFGRLGGKHQASATPDVAGEIQRVFKRLALAKGKR